jgi:protein phosphatase
MQTALTILLLAAVAVIAYLIGERRALKAAARAAAGPARATPEVGDVRKADPGAQVGPAGAGEVPSVSTPAAADARRDAIRPPEQSDEERGESRREPAPTSGDAPSLDPDIELGPLVRLDYEEDDNVEPTKIGPAASGPPSERRILQPPIQKIELDPGASDPAPDSAPLFLVHATAQTDKGMRRKRNEDSLGVLENHNLFIVADGMGGYAGGEQASRIAVETIMEAFRCDAFEGEEHGDIPRAASELARAVQMANAAIGEEAQKQHALAGMGTTVCAAVFSPTRQRVFIAHVGDSRCYRLRDGVFTQLTNDHTMAELGMKGPESRQLSRAVGIWPTVQIDVLLAVPKTGDVYLLCSDGLTKMLSDDIIGNVLRNEDDPKVAVERLIFFANAHGGKDNITLVLVRVVPIEWRPRPSEPFRPASIRPPSDSSGEAPPSSKGPPAGAAAFSRARTPVAAPVAVKPPTSKKE